MELSDDIKINRFKLPEECERHPSMYYYWSNLLADAKKECDRAEDQLKFTLADQEMNIRASAENTGMKLTEGGVKASLEINTEVLAARKALRNAQKDRYHLEAAVNSLEHRRSQLDNLTKLGINQFYSAPSGASTSTRPDPLEDAQQNVRGGLKRKGPSEPSAVS